MAQSMKRGDYIHATPDDAEIEQLKLFNGVRPQFDVDMLL